MPQVSRTKKKKRWEEKVLERREGNPVVKLSQMNQPDVENESRPRFSRALDNPSHSRTGLLFSKTWEQNNKKKGIQKIKINASPIGTMDHLGPRVTHKNPTYIRQIQLVQLYFHALNA